METGERRLGGDMFSEMFAQSGKNAPGEEGSKAIHSSSQKN
jgi:hypothetical protein